MKLRNILWKVCIWWAVLGWSIWVGGTVFHMVVIVPLWSASPPESVRAFFGSTHFYHTVWNFFGPPWMIARTLPLVLLLFLGWKSASHRPLLLLIMVGTLFNLVYTLTYIYPINDILMGQAGDGGSPDEIRSMVDRWVFADRLRFAIGAVAYIALLRVFAIPLRGKGANVS